MRRLALTARLLATVGAAVPAASAADGFYFTPSIGYAWGEAQDFRVLGTEGGVSYDGGVVVAAALGYRFGDFRVEGDLGYANLSLDAIRLGSDISRLGSDIHAYSGAIGGYYDFLPDSRIRPYLGGGIGFATLDADEIVADGEEFEGGTSTDLTFHGEAGLSYFLSENIEVVTSYRYTWADLGSEGLEDVEDFGAHQLRFGVRFGF